MASTSNSAHTRHWERGFAALSKFRAREGHCSLPRQCIERGFKLGQWVSVQRYRRDFLPVERKRRLDKIGFVWNWRDFTWERGFAALLKFKKREGNCRVPIFYSEGKYKLGWWVSTQRAKRRRLSAERKARLNRIGFVWWEHRGSRRAAEIKTRISAPNPLRPRASLLAHSDF